MLFRKIEAIILCNILSCIYSQDWENEPDVSVCKMEGNSAKLEWKYSSTGTLVTINWHYLGPDGLTAPKDVMLFDGTDTFVTTNYVNRVNYTPSTRSASIDFSSTVKAYDNGVFDVAVVTDVPVPVSTGNLSVYLVSEVEAGEATLTLEGLSDLFELKDTPIIPIENGKLPAGNLKGVITMDICVPPNTMTLSMLGVPDITVPATCGDTNCSFNILSTAWKIGDSLCIDADYGSNVKVGPLCVELGTETTTEPPGGLSGGLIAAIVVPVVVVVVVVIVVAVLAAKKKLPHQKSKGKTATGGSQDASKLGSGAARGNQGDGDVGSGATKGSQGPGDSGSVPPRDSEEARYSDESKRL